MGWGFYKLLLQFPGRRKGNLLPSNASPVRHLGCGGGEFFPFRRWESRWEDPGWASRGGRFLPNLVRLHPKLAGAKRQLLSSASKALSPHPSTGGTEGSKLGNVARATKLGSSRTGAEPGPASKASTSRCHWDLPAKADPPSRIPNSASPSGCVNAGRAARCVAELALPRPRFPPL